jgi:hypothetical protein
MYSGKTVQGIVDIVKVCPRILITDVQHKKPIVKIFESFPPNGWIGDPLWRI